MDRSMTMWYSSNHQPIQILPYNWKIESESNPQQHNNGHFSRTKSGKIKKNQLFVRCFMKSVLQRKKNETNHTRICMEWAGEQKKVKTTSKRKKAHARTLSIHLHTTNFIFIVVFSILKLCVRCVQLFFCFTFFYCYCLIINSKYKWTEPETSMEEGVRREE